MRSVLGIYRKVPQSHRWIILISWLLVHSLLLVFYHLNTSLEGAKYVREANNLLSGNNLSTGAFSFYFTQIFLNLVAIKLALWPYGVYVVQLVFNLASTFLFYKLCFHFTKKPLVQLVATLALIFCIPFQWFYTTIYTEPIFFSLIIIFTYFLFSKSSNSFKTVLFIFTLLVWLCFTRPTGIYLLPPTIIYLVFNNFKTVRPGYKWLIVGVGAVVSLVLLNAALQASGSWDFMLPFREEHIICGVPTKPEGVLIDTSTNGDSVGGIIYYVTHNIGQFLGLSWRKFLAFFGLYRDYYSLSHNLFLIGFFYPLFLLGLIGFFLRNNISAPKLIFMLSYIAITALSVIFSCDDWHNRFIFTLVPFFYLLAIPALEQIVGRVENSKKH